MRNLLLTLLCAFASSSAALAAAPGPWTFQTFFAGEWAVQQSTFSADGAQHKSDLVGHYSLARRDESDALEGRSFDNDTASGELSNQLSLLVEFTPGAASAGTLYTGEGDGAEDELAPLFDFDFVEQPNGMHVSRGEWKAKAGASYQFVAVAPNSFLITVRTDGEDGEVVFAGSRVLDAVEKTFFQKYGTMMMMGAFFLFNNFMQRRARGGAADAAAAGAGAAPVTETAEAAPVPAASKKDN